MKKSLLLLLNAFLTFAVMSQAPAQINYQGVARNSVGNVLPNQSISLRLSIHDGSAAGPVVYQETRNLKTNLFGMFTVAIGGTGASGVTGRIADVDWVTGGSKYLQVEMDPTGKNNFLDMGTSPLLSVPYAMAAGSAIPAGNAGGSLAGTYPNPMLAPNAVTNNNIADGSITANKLAPGVLSNTGNAGGDLSGTYPNPNINSGAVTTGKIADGSVTAAKIAAGVIPTSLPPIGNAGGDLNGSYPNPTINNDAVTTGKIADGSVTSAKLAAGVIPTSLPPIGTAGGDLNGSYPNPTINNDAVTTGKIADGSVTATKLAAGVIPTSLPPSGTAGGDLNGSYPNPTINNDAVTTGKIADGSVTATKLAAGVIPTSLPPIGTAGGDLSGTYPNPKVTAIQGVDVSAAAPSNGQVLKYSGGQWVPSAATAAPSGSAGGDLIGTYPNPQIAPNVINSNNIVNDAVTTQKIADGSVTSVKLAAGVIPTSLPPTGTAGGDLSGTYPNPTINNDAITTVKIADGSVTSAKLAAGVIPTSLPPTGTAGGDLSGTFPNPAVNKIQGVTISTTAPATGQILRYDGTQWKPDTETDFTLPYSTTIASASSLLSITNSSTGTAIQGINSSGNAKSFGIEGIFSSPAIADSSAGIKGVNYGDGYLNSFSFGIWGEHKGYGTGVLGQSAYGTAAIFQSGPDDNFADAVDVTHLGLGHGLVSISQAAVGVAGVTYAPDAVGVMGFNNSGGTAMMGITWSATEAAVIGQNAAEGPAVLGESMVNGNGVGVIGKVFADPVNPGNAIVGEIKGAGLGNPAVFKVDGTNVARIDQNGTGYFNGGTVNGGADVAEYFDVEGNRAGYEPGDVLVISTNSDRTVERSAAPYSTLVAGVYATKPGVLLTEKNADKNELNDGVPMGVIGVIPTKVCMEGGAIKRGDLIVTSSIPGVAMKADPDKVKVGQVIGKALQDFNGTGIQKINVLVSIK